ncbi:7-cyano-7-deazaguanine synthase QueC [Acidobacteria bacterium AH-259-A15]|nr:7-cyano-7-deazaguanine synthase QueC [Acidobacteria bacterium AH-259-A15]
MPKTTILIYSGGIDSTTLLYSFLSKGYGVKALGIDYGQRHLKELTAARNICENLGVEFRVGNLAELRPLLAGSSLTSQEVDVPEGYYTDESMKLTVVPNRNMLMMSVAIAWAISSDFDSVAYAAHAGDHAIYPDCRPEFVDALARAAALCHYHSIQILRPFMQKTKAEIVKMGHELRVPFSLTWSCYKGGELHCGRCGTCTERAEAFLLAGVSDPTTYASAPRIPEGIRKMSS